MGEVKCGESLHLSCKRDQIKMIDYMDRRVTPPNRVTSSTLGPQTQRKTGPKIREGNQLKAVYRIYSNKRPTSN